MNQRFNSGLFVIGVRKCGTTTVFDFLKNTGQFRACRIKEPQFFCLPEGVIDLHLDWYAGLFPSAATGQPILDGSTLYAQEPDFRQRIGRHVDVARFVLCLRDPARRMFSAYWHQRAKPGGVEKRSFEEILDELENARGNDLFLAEQTTLEAAQSAGKIDDRDLGADYHRRHFGAPFYSEGLDKWMFFRYAGESLYSRHWADWAPGSDLHLVIFEQLLQRPEATLRSIIQFAGLPPGTALLMPPNRNKTFDAGRNPWLDQLARWGLLDRIKRWTPDRLKFLLKEKWLPETEKMTPVQYQRARRLLQTEYAFWFEKYPLLEQWWK